MNSETRRGGMIIDEESATTFPTVFDPSASTSRSTSTNYLGAGDLININDGSPLIWDTKESIMSESHDDIEDHGVVAFLNIQPQYLVKALQTSADQHNLFGRMLIVFPPRKTVKYYDEQKLGPINPYKEVSSALKAMNLGSPVTFREVLSTDTSIQAEARIIPEGFVPEFEDFLFEIWKSHRSIDNPVMYTVTSDAFDKALGPAFVGFEEIILTASTPFQKKFAVKAHSKLLKMILPIHALWHHYSPAGNNPLPTDIKLGNVGKLSVSLLSNQFNG